MSNRFKLVVDEQLRAHHNETCNSFPVESTNITKFTILVNLMIMIICMEIGQVHEWVFGLNSHTCPLSNLYILGEYFVMKNIMFFLAHKK